MKKLVVALPLIVLSVLAPLAAHAEEARLPFNPFEKAQKGDWCIATGTFKREGAGENKVPCASYARVVKVENDEVTVSEQVQVGAVEKASKKFSTKQAPTVAAFFDLKEGEVSNVKVEDEKRSICGKELACKKLTFTWKHDHSVDEVTAWLSPDVKAGGLAAFKLSGHLKAKVELATQIKLECAGCGTGNDKTMGESPEDILDADLLGEADEALEMPFQPFDKSKTGDWTAVRVEADMGGRVEVGVVNFEVVKAKKDSIELEVTMKRGPGAGDTNQIKLDRSKPLTVLEYASMIVKGRAPHGNEKVHVTGLKIVEDKRTVGEREFACKKISFSFKEHDSTIKVKLWVSPDSKGLGLVGGEVRAKRRGEDMKFDIELGGFGDDDKTEWGKTAEQLSKKKRKKTEDDE